MSGLCLFLVAAARCTTTWIGVLETAGRWTINRSGGPVGRLPAVGVKLLADRVALMTPARAM